jgi:hypothetical protein
VWRGAGVCRRRPSPRDTGSLARSWAIGAIGAITQPLIEWINRPTFQQSDEIQGHAGG